jgi:PAS domain S-box-containing protein
LSPKYPIEALSDEQRLQLLVHAVVDYALFMLNPDGLVVTWNAGARKLKGYDEKEILGQHFSCFFTPEDQRRGQPSTVLQNAAKDGRFESEGWRVRKDGSQFWALAVVDAIRDEAGELLGFVKITRDMTERREAASMEQRFRQLVEGVIDYAIFHLDPNGIVSTWNAGAERIKATRRPKSSVRTSVDFIRKTIARLASRKGRLKRRS